MTPTVIAAFVLGLLVGAGLLWLPARALLISRTAALRAQRDLLRDRVTDLEAAAGQDRELAATLGPLFPKSWGIALTPIRPPGPGPPRPPAGPDPSGG